jgi:hypothetical protein
MADVVVAPVDEMTDENLMRHLENRHADDLRLEFKAAPGEDARTLAAPDLWRTYHQTMHRLYPRKYEHTHRDTVRGS